MLPLLALAVKAVRLRGLGSRFTRSFSAATATGVSNLAGKYNRVDPLYHVSPHLAEHQRQLDLANPAAGVQHENHQLCGDKLEMYSCHVNAQNTLQVAHNDVCGRVRRKQLLVRSTRAHLSSPVKFSNTEDVCSRGVLLDRL